jgi:hypothetical protein
MITPEYFELVYTLEMEDYITHVQTSEKRRPKYYSSIAGRGRVNKLPKRLEKEGYTVDKFGFYINKEKERVVANTRSVGTPKQISINSQVLYVGKPWERVAMKNALEEFFLPYVNEMPVFNFPIAMECELHINATYHTADLNNTGYIYEKVLTDVMVKQGKIFDDSIPYITKPGSSPLYVPIEEGEKRKLIYKIYKDKREEILQLKLL